MTAAAETPVIFVDPDDDVDAPSIPIRLNYRVEAGTRVDADFAAVGQIPYIWAAELLASGTGPPSEQSRALIVFFERAVVENDQARFFELLHDRQVRVKARTLQDIAEYLLDRYLGLDPTPARRSAGPSRSRSGQRSTGRGSAGRSTAKASASKRPTRRT